MSGRACEVLVGDVREQLRTLPDDYLHMVCTSPPYWALRDYGLPPQVWGGRRGAEEACDGGDHQWEDQTYHLQRHGDDGDGSLQGSTSGQRATRFGAVASATCARCGAWRGSLGLEPTPALYLEHMVEVFREVRRVLRPDGVCFLNLGDSYTSGGRATRAPDAKNGGRAMDERPPTPAGLKPKDLVGMPWRLAFALQDDGWWLRTDIVWQKTNGQPEAVDDRPTRCHEFIFLLTKSADYFWDAEAVREPVSGTAHSRGAGTHKKSAAAGTGIRQNSSFGGRARSGGEALVEKRNLRSVWTFPTQPNPEAHFAAFPERLPELCILAGTSEVGCCSRCGAPLERLVEKVRTVDGEPAELPPMKDQSLEAPSQAYGVGHYRSATATQTVGWRATCDCPLSPPAPCRVGDPFAGTGTTGIAAAKLGRHFVGVELNPEYAAISRSRLARVTQGAIAAARERPQALDHGPLFTRSGT